MSQESGLQVGLASAEPKWAAIVNDRLIPMPRQRLSASVILHQAGEPVSGTLVRDFNSPHDVGFEPDTIVDLAGGNVFRVVSDCSRSGNVRSDSPPKLAFVVDDRFEVTIQPRQTGKTLRGLLNIPPESRILRDLESPTDTPIGDDEKFSHADGPVFVTRRDGTVTIIVEGTPHVWTEPRISYAEVVTLFDPSYPQHPETFPSVEYEGGPPSSPEGILSPGASVKVKDRMVFNVSATGQS